MGMKVIYVAGPYRAQSEDEVFNNIVHAREVAVELWQAGWAVICPHTNSFFMGTRLGDDCFIEGDLEILSRCDAVYMMSNYEGSEGAKLELAKAKELGLEIIFESGGL